jgi:ornithine cyclodeaminase/alanine dehydrogenase-like protein (mu-crystallin family)
MDTVVLTQEDVARLLPMGACIDAMAEALSAVSSGDAVQPLRSMQWLPDRTGLLATMPAMWPAARTMAVKVISVFPSNHGTELDSHQGAVLLFDAMDGRLVAVVDATEVTAIRTAAVSGAATRVLAREDAGDLAILGAGVQARTHLEAMRAVRPIRRVRVWSRSPERAAAFAARAGDRLDIPVESATDPEAAVRGADLVCTTTSASEPILRGAWLSPGAHVNAIGAVGPANRELDSDAVVRARLFVDRRESALAEAGEVVLAVAEGAIDVAHIAGEVGEVVAGTVPGRTGPQDITVFRGVGLAVEDLAAVRVILAGASREGAGLRVELGGRRRDA